MSHAMKILVVDAEAAHCARLLAEAAAYIEPIEIVVAAIDDVADVLARTTIDGVVLDLDLGEDAAAQVVGEVERRFAGVPLVAIASRVDDTRVASACHLGAAAILAKPFGIAALVQMMRTPAGDAGFLGACGGIPTAQLLTLHCGAGHDGVLHLRVGATATRPERTGSLFLEAGQPVHAVAGAMVGADAVHAMLGWRELKRCCSWREKHYRAEKSPNLPAWRMGPKHVH